VEVKADDDFAEVKWVPLGLLDPAEMYSDHYWIIHKMLDSLPVD
jgi:bifunctional NMN adenylyltransferase/nudix hydrolase